MRGIIAIVAVTICCLADPLTPWVNLQSEHRPADLQFDNQAIRLQNQDGSNTHQVISSHAH
jgi:hypothetical protein